MASRGTSSPPATLGLVLPLFDEADTCEHTAAGVESACRAAGLGLELVLVDNGSRDGTSEIADRLADTLPGCRALHLPANAGYGGGILAGMRTLQTPVVGWAWGDGQVAPEVAVAACRRLLDERLDMCKAVRTRRLDGALRKTVSIAYNALVGALFDPGTRDVNGCPKLFTREAWLRLDARGRDWFLDAEVVLKARELGLRCGEVEAAMLPRAGGASKVDPATVAEFARHIWAWRGGWRPGRSGGDDG